MRGIKVALIGVLIFVLMLSQVFSVFAISQDSYLEKVSDVKSVAAGYAHMVFVKNDGTVWTCGDNFAGQLGIGDFNPISAAERVFGLSDIIDVAAGESFSLALQKDGTVWAWGDNYFGQLGDGALGDASRRVEIPTPLKVLNLDSVIDIAAGCKHSIALKSDGTVWMWGGFAEREYSEPIEPTSIPVQVGGLTEVVAIASGSEHCVALKSDGTVWTWGYNYNGQLGIGSFENKWEPVMVEGVNDTVSIAAGDDHTLAIKNDGTVWACGENIYGELGTGLSSMEVNAPVKIEGLEEIVCIAAGWESISAVKSDGKVLSLGGSYSGQLGNIISGEKTDIPVEVSGIADIVSVAAGSRFKMAINSKGDLFTWGDDYKGQLSLGKSGGDEIYATQALANDSFDISDTSLRNLFINGRAFELFSPEKTQYELYFSGHPDVIPSIDAVPLNPDSEINVTQADDIPGTAVIEIVAEDGMARETYSVEFVLESETPEPMPAPQVVAHIDETDNGFYVAGKVVNAVEEYIYIKVYNSKDELCFDGRDLMSRDGDYYFAKFIKVPGGSEDIFSVYLTTKGLEDTVNLTYYCRLNTSIPTPTQNHTSMPTATPVKVILTGDINGDDSINSIDFALLRMYLLGIIETFPYYYGLQAADVNHDGLVNSIDFATLRGYLLGTIAIK